MALNRRLGCAGFCAKVPRGEGGDVALAREKEVVFLAYRRSAPNADISPLWHGALGFDMGACFVRWVEQGHLPSRRWCSGRVHALLPSESASTATVEEFTDTPALTFRELERF